MRARLSTLGFVGLAAGFLAGTPLATPVSLMGEITGAGLVLSVGVRATF
jgi:hypothetical protein